LVSREFVSKGRRPYKLKENSDGGTLVSVLAVDSPKKFPSTKSFVSKKYFAKNGKFNN
jgi:hypothetical protein